MRKPRNWRKAALLIAGLIIVCLSLVWWRLQTFSFAKSLLPYTRSWDQIQLGDTRTVVEQKCPERNQKHYYEQANNYYYDAHKYGFWELVIEYDAGDKVRAKDLKLRIGTKEIFSDFDYGSEH